MANSLFKNFLSLAGAETFTKLITFAAFAYLARLFGASGFGYIEWAGAVLMCASLIVDQGFSAYGAREIAKNPGQTANFVAEIVTARFAFAAAAYLTVLIFAFLFVEQAILRQLLLLYGLSLWILPFLLQWVFQGHDRMHTVAIAQIVRQTIFVTVIFIFVRNADDLLIIGAAEVVAVFCAAAFTLWMCRRNFPPHIKFRPMLSVKLLREGMPIGFSQMFWVIKMFGATFIVGLVATADDTGHFAGAMRIYIALHTFVWLYFANLLPSFSRARKEGSEKFAGLIKNSLRTVLPLGFIGALVWFFAAPFVIKAAFGQDFAAGAGALQWLAGACYAAAISGHYRFGLIAAGFQTKEMWASASGAAAAIVLIPVFYLNAGTSGAGAALCVAEFFILFVVWLISKRKLFSADSLQVKENNFKNLSEATR